MHVLVARKDSTHDGRYSTKKNASINWRDVEGAERKERRKILNSDGVSGEGDFFSFPLSGALGDVGLSHR